MIDNRRLVFWLRPFTLASLALAMCGCAEVLGPERMPVSRVKGRVTEGGRPVHGGWIEFFPVDGTVGNLRSARLHPDGSFEADRVAVGLNVIRLVNTSIEAPGVARIFGEYTSPIRRAIPEQPGDSLTIDVVDEAIRYQDSRLQRASPESQRPGGPR
ncbi:MAG: hypothetical protein ACHRXM_26295 [Isosphaerales bacterium]